MLNHLSNSLFAGAEGPKVLGRRRGHIVEQFENDAAGRDGADLHVEKAARFVRLRFGHGAVSNERRTQPPSSRWLGSIVN